MNISNPALARALNAHPSQQRKLRSQREVKVKSLTCNLDSQERPAERFRLNKHRAWAVRGKNNCSDVRRFVDRKNSSVSVSHTAPVQATPRDVERATRIQAHTSSDASFEEKKEPLRSWAVGMKVRHAKHCDYSPCVLETEPLPPAGKVGGDST